MKVNPLRRLPLCPKLDTLPGPYAKITMNQHRKNQPQNLESSFSLFYFNNLKPNELEQSLC